jgi:isopentenyldiphosphate isomerase
MAFLKKFPRTKATASQTRHTKMPVPSQAQRPDEIFDIVDEHDRVTGQSTRAEVHAKHLRHRAVHAWAFNRDGRLFLQKRSLQKDTAPGRWDSSASGHLDAGETYDAAVVRELSEEIGVTVSPQNRLTLLHTVPATPETANEFTRVYRLETEGPFTLNPAEISGGEWFRPAEIDRLLRETPAAFSQTFAHLWRLHRKNFPPKTP